MAFINKIKLFIFSFLSVSATPYTYMIPVLRSIDNLLHRFDELSICHRNFLSYFDKNFSNMKNPLKDVTRSEDEQRKLANDMLLVITEDENEKESIKTVEDFHQHIIKNRYLHRPPQYSFNGKLPPTSSFSKNRHSSSVSKPSNQSTIKVFSMETVNRLSKPKAYYQSTVEKSKKKYIKRRSKFTKTIKSDKSKCSNLPSIKLPPIKPIKGKTIKTIPKRSQAPTLNSSSPVIFLMPVPTTRLIFPTDLERPLPRLGFLPKVTMRSQSKMKYFY